VRGLRTLQGFGRLGRQAAHGGDGGKLGESFEGANKDAHDGGPEAHGAAGETFEELEAQV
jgi:hypothetical protein